MRRRQTDRQQGRIRQYAKGHAEGAVDQLRAEPDGEEQPPVIHGRLPRAGRPAYHALHLLRPMRPFAAIGQPEIPQRSEGREVAKENATPGSGPALLALKRLVILQRRQVTRPVVPKLPQPPDSSVTSGLGTDSTSPLVVLFCR